MLGPPWWWCIGCWKCRVVTWAACQSKTFTKNNSQYIKASKFAVESNKTRYPTLYHVSYRFLGFTSQPSRHFTKVIDSPGENSVFAGSWAQNVNLWQHKKISVNVFKDKHNPGGVASSQLFPPHLLFLRLSSFHANPPDFQYRFGRLCVPGPERLLNVLPDWVPGVSFSFPAQINL